MESKSLNKFKTIFAIIALVVAISLAIITTIILNNKQKNLDDLNDKNDQIENVLSITENFWIFVSKIIDNKLNIWYYKLHN